MNNDQIKEFITQCHRSGMSKAQIINQLVQSGWPSEAATTTVQAHLPIDPKRKRMGIFLLLSPIFVMVFVMLLQFIVRFAVAAGSNGDVSTSPLYVMFNLLSLFLGILGVLLIPVGPILGIITLTKK